MGILTLEGSSALANVKPRVHKWLEGLSVGCRERRYPTGPRALGRRLRLPFMPLGAAELGAETRGRRAGLWVSAARSAASRLTLPSVHPRRQPTGLQEAGRFRRHPLANSGLNAPACEPACLPNVTVK